MTEFRKVGGYWLTLVLLLSACGSNAGKPDGSGAGGEGTGGSGMATAGAGGSSTGGSSTGGSGGMAQCPSFANYAVECSLSCFGNCYGLTAGGVADPSNHVGDCVYTLTGNILAYCAPWGVSDPCSHCP